MTGLGLGSLNCLRLQPEANHAFRSGFSQISDKSSFVLALAQINLWTPGRFIRLKPIGCPDYSIRIKARLLSRRTSTLKVEAIHIRITAGKMPYVFFFSMNRALSCL